MSRLNNLNPYDKHKFIINEYVLNRPGRTKLLKRNESDDKTDINIIREHHKFLWEENDNNDDNEDECWEQQLAKKYYDKLFKEYCICDLTRYKENKVALRWRIEREVIDGKGQFICGNKICSITSGLRSWEVNFVYMEHGEVKNALVKLRLCEDCSKKLNYRSKKREIKRIKKSKKKDRSRLANDNNSNSTEETSKSKELVEKFTGLMENSNEQLKPDKESHKKHKYKKKHSRKADDVLLRKHDFEKHIEELLY